jgi:hypothetical protein
MRRLVDSFTVADHPELIFMSGGEPMLRPAMVADLASRARAVGTRSCVLSGMFFARRRITPALKRAIGSLDHFAASIDAFHEREVSRTAVFAALRQVLDLTPAVSLHVTSTDQAYLDDLLPQVRTLFGERVPVLVGRVLPSGRARSFVAKIAEPAEASPCEFASWPLVDYDGTVFACSRQSLARAHRAAHLVLGHADRDSWTDLRERTLSCSVLRSVRVMGPIETARRGGSAVGRGYCETCVALALPVEVPPALELMVHDLLSGRRPADLARRWGAGSHADLVELGWTPCAD